MQSSEPIAMAMAVAVPRELNSSGTITKSEDAGVTHDSVSSVPPTTPIERESFFGPPAELSGAADAVADGSSVSVIRVPIGSARRARCCAGLDGAGRGAISPP